MVLRINRTYEENGTYEKVSSSTDYVDIIKK